MAYPSVTNSFVNNSLMDAAQCNQNFNDVVSGITDGTKDFNVNTFTASMLSVATDVYTVAYSDYFSLSTITGWDSVGLSGNIYYKKIGAHVSINYYITGTSTATTASFTLPYNYKLGVVFTASGTIIHDMSGQFGVQICNNAISQGITLSKFNNDNRITIYPNSYGGGDLGGFYPTGNDFLNSGAKTIAGVINYEV
jgi:hypothetical protein